MNLRNSNKLSLYLFSMEINYMGFMVKMYISMVRLCFHGGIFKGGNKT